VSSGIGASYGDATRENAPMTSHLDPIRGQLVEMIEARGAHMPFDAAVADFPAEGLNRVVPNGVYTPWHLLEHIRFAQADILDYIRNPGYLEPTWPDNYWPARDAQATLQDFARTVASFRADRSALHDLVLDPATDLFATIPGTPGHTILREIRVVAAHNAYHIGEFAILRQVMGTWPPDREDR
jgi:hypothetical protein